MYAIQEEEEIFDARHVKFRARARVRDRKSIEKKKVQQQRDM